MNAKTWAPLAVAIVLGLLAAVVARKSLLSNRAVSAAPRTISVVVASTAIPPGHELTTDDVKLAPIASPTVPPEMSVQTSDLIGRVTIAPLFAGQPVQQTFLAPKGTAAGLQALVPTGMRAITIDVNESSGIAGLLTPGCRVDVVTTAISQANPDKSASRIIVQDVPVLAVGQRLNGAKPEGEKDTAVSRTVTLLVSPHDAQALDLGMAATRLRLILRGVGDNQETDDDGVMFAELRGGSSSFMQTLPAQPVIAQTPIATPTTEPTTRPAQPDRVFAMPTRRVVTIILGSEERRVSFREDRPDVAAHDEVSDVRDQGDKSHE